MTMLIDDLLKRNRAFVAGRVPKPLPAAETVSLAVVACFDPRLDPLLRPALGLGDGDGFMIRTAGAVVAPDSHTLRNLALAVYLFEVELVLVVGHTSCRMASFPTGGLIDAFRRRGMSREAFGDGDLRTWAGAISSPRAGVLASAAAIAGAPFLPPDLKVAGAVLDDTTGALEMVLRPNDRSRRGQDAGAARPPAPDAPPPVPKRRSPASGDTAPAGAPLRPAEGGQAKPPSIEAPQPSGGGLRQAVRKLATIGRRDDLRRLRSAVETEVYPLNKLALLRRFVQRAAADSPEVQEAFARLESQVQGAGYDQAEKTLSDLFGPLLRRPRGQKKDGRKR